MLEKIRDGSQGVVAKTILGVVILSFALAGICGYLGGSSDVASAIVNGQAISSAQVEQEFQRDRARLEQQFGQMFQSIANNESYMNGVRKGALDRLIARELIKQTAAKMDIRVGDEEIKQAIRDDETFHVDGKFDNNRYLAAIARARYRVEQYRELVRSEMIQNQLVSSISNTDFTLKNEAQLIAQLEQQSRDIRLIEVNASDFVDDITIIDEQVSSYYDLNNTRFMTTEQVSLQYIDLKVSDLKAKVTIAPELVQAAYDENVEQYKTAERRKLSHILIEFGDDEAAAKALAQATLAKINSGSDFAELAKEVSQDSFSAQNGGDLDWVEPGVMETSFDEAAFALVLNETSNVIRTEFGFHLIKATEISPVTTRAFADVKDSIEQELLVDEAKELFYELQQQLADLAFEVPENLDEAAIALDVNVKETALFARFSAPASVNFPDVINAAFSEAVLGDGINSDVIEINSDHLIVVRLKQHNPSEVKSLIDVKAQIVTTLKQEKAQDLAQDKAQEYFDAWQAGSDVTGATVIDKLAVLRSDKALDSAIVAATFKLAKPSSDAKSIELVTTRNGQAIIKLVGVNDASDVSGKVLSVTERLNRANRGSTINTFIESLKKNSDIQYPAS